MASRLSELLERIRPAGTPGAASDLVSQRRRATAEEIAELSLVLRRFDTDVDDLLDDARARAARIRADALRQAARVRADLPDRIAVEEASGVQPIEDRSQHEIARISDESERRIALVRSQAAERTDGLVDAAIAVIWSLLPEPAATPS